MLENEWTNQELDKVEKFASENKASVLTIMYDDIERSSVTTEQIGDDAFDELKEKYHDKPFIEIVTRKGCGEIIKHRGDGFMTVFLEPSAAVEYALELQQKFYKDGKIKVRIGLDMGQVRVKDMGVHKDLIGRHANWAARAETMSDAGHILVTRPVYDDASAWICKSRVSWKRHGFYNLKKGEQPLELFEPYNANLIQPLEQPRGNKAGDERMDCSRCGFSVKVQDTFRCKVCGDSGICKEHYDPNYQQCVKCTSEMFPKGTELNSDTKNLLDLKNANSAFRIKVWSEENRNIKVTPRAEFSKYKIGDKVAVYFESTEDAYVYIFNIGPKGDITPLFPNKLCQNNCVKANMVFRFPDEKANFEWELQEPAGTEIIKVFATKTHVADMSIWMKEMRFSKADTRNIKVVSKSVEKMPPDQWAESSCSFVVFKP